MPQRSQVRHTQDKQNDKQSWFSGIRFYYYCILCLCGFIPCTWPITIPCALVSLVAEIIRRCFKGGGKEKSKGRDIKEKSAEELRRERIQEEKDKRIQEIRNRGMQIEQESQQAIASIKNEKNGELRQIQENH